MFFHCLRKCDSRQWLVGSAESSTVLHKSRFHALFFSGVIAGIGEYIYAPQAAWVIWYYPLQWISLGSRNMEQSWTERFVEIELVDSSRVCPPI